MVHQSRSVAIATCRQQLAFITNYKSESQQNARPGGRSVNSQRLHIEQLEFQSRCAQPLSEKFEIEACRWDRVSSLSAIEDMVLGTLMRRELKSLLDEVGTTTIIVTHDQEEAIVLASRIVGFFVSAIGVGLIFDGVIEALEMHGITSLH